MKIYDARGHHAASLVASRRLAELLIPSAALLLDAPGLRALAEACTYMAGAIDADTTVGAPDEQADDQADAEGRSPGEDAGFPTADEDPLAPTVREHFRVVQLSAPPPLDRVYASAGSYDDALDVIQEAPAGHYRVEKIYRRLDAGGAR